MRILYLSSATGTLGNHSHKFLKGLVEHGYDVHLVSYHPLPIAKNIKEIEGLKIYHFPPSIIKKPFYFNTLFHFKKLLKYIKPDLIHSGNLFNESFLAALSGFHPILVMPYGSDILVFPNKSKIFYYINKYVFLKADHVICDAYFIKDEIVRRYKYNNKRIDVFPFGVELEIFHRNINSTFRELRGWENNTIIIMNRHFEPIYDPVTAIESFGEAFKINKEIRLLLVGDGSLKQEIISVINKKGLERYVYLTGRVSRAEMAELLNASDIYISSSKSDGTSVSLLEAMACGKPVIVSDIPTNREWINNGINGFLAPVGDKETFTQHILTLSSDNELQKEMGNRNYIIANERADWRKNLKKLREIYESILIE